MKKKAPRVFLDTTVLKYSATRVLQYVDLDEETRDAEGNVTGKFVSTVAEVNPNDRLPDASQEAEADLIPEIANLARSGAIEAVTSLDVNVEYMGLRNNVSVGGVFYGAPIVQIQHPFLEAIPRLIADGHHNTHEIQVDFIKSIRHPRFDRLKRITGAYQGEKPTRPNQLIDAFHIWCAEANDCRYLLTLDRSLIRVTLKHKKELEPLQLVAPFELLQHVKSP